MFAVVCDATKEPRAVLEDLGKAQVDIIHFASNKKNSTYDKLKQLMRRFSDLNRDGSRLVLISGDMDFAAEIADFKRRMCSSVILLHNSNASESLILAASQAHSFYDITSTLHRRGHTSPEEYPTIRFPSQDSLHSYVDVEYKEEKKAQRLLDVSASFHKISISKMKEHAAQIKQRHLNNLSVVQSSSEEEIKKDKLSKKTHSKIRSKLKLKNRMKSEATQQFLN